MTRLLARFSPVAGIQWVETKVKDIRSCNEYCFSPVAGIQWVETSAIYNWFMDYRVSVPLPGFSGLRLVLRAEGGEAGTFQSRCRDSVG